MVFSPDCGIIHSCFVWLQDFKCIYQYIGPTNYYENSVHQNCEVKPLVSVSLKVIYNYCLFK